MKRFEYRTEIIGHRDSTMGSNVHVHPEDLDPLLNMLGAEGWEVWQLDGSIVRLKREIPDGGFHPG